jgi:serine/threonine protein kinase
MNYPRVGVNRWEEMRSLFEAALLRSEQEWPEYLASRCGDDKEFAAEIHRLLVADRDSGQFMAEPLFSSQNLLGNATPQGDIQPHRILCERFEVLTYLGEGGMGHVYEAFDLELRQRIAIKAIRSEIANTPGVLSLFKREILAARRVNHPNVCRTFDLECHDSIEEPAGTKNRITFLTMELLNGENLAQRLRRSGPLPSREVQELAFQVASALIAAHDAGIVHRDLKPSNIFLTCSESRFRAVVTDFGIAKVVQSSDQTDLSRLAALHAYSELCVGTPAYMAPEQFERGLCSASSDLYSFGLVIYEALTGQRLFPLSCTPNELRNRLKHAADDATSNDVAWELILSGCLRADPKDRFAQGRQVLELLQRMPTSRLRRMLSARRVLQQQTHDTIGRWTALPAINRAALLGAFIIMMLFSIAFIPIHRQFNSDESAASMSTVAVLPFSNPNKDPDLYTLSHSMAVNLTNELASASGLSVPSQAVVASLDDHTDLRSINRQLRVDTVVEGSIIKVGDGLLVDVELIDSHTGAQRWGQRYRLNRNNLSAWQQTLSQEIAFRLRSNAYPSKIKQEKHIPLLPARAAYMRGKEALAENTPASVERAANDFEQAIDADPKFASAFAQLAQCYLSMANNYNRPEAALDLRNKAEEAARRALQLDGTSAEAYTDIAKIQVVRDFNWGAAEDSFSRAVQLDPGYIPAHISYAFFLLTARGRFVEARMQYAYADRVVPKLVGADVHEALSEYFARHYAESIERAAALRRSHPEIEILTEILAEDYLAMNRPSEVVTLLRQYDPKSKDAKISRDAMLGIAFARLGQKRKALRILTVIERSKQPNFDLFFQLAALSAAVGDKDRAFDDLEKAYDRRQTSIVFLGVDALMDSLRPIPRFQRMLDKLNLNNPAKEEDKAQ